MWLHLAGCLRRLGVLIKLSHLRARLENACASWHHKEAVLHERVNYILAIDGDSTEQSNFRMMRGSSPCTVHCIRRTLET